MSETPQDAIASSLWLISRSTIETGTTYCAFRRWIENHAGPYGYGMQRRAMSVPLVTGTYVHEAIALILGWILEAKNKTGKQPAEVPAELIRWAIQQAGLKYRKVIETRGFLTSLLQDNAEDNKKLQLLITEQEWLIEGLVWAFCFARLPQILAEYEIMFVEEEEDYVLACSCGLGDGLGDIGDHERRGCAGIGLLSRPDILGRRWVDQAWGYIELKTSSTAKRKWNDSWERKQQFLMGIAGAERKHAQEITHFSVEGLIKGQRKQDQYDPDPDSPKKQQTCLIYVYYAPPIPPEQEAKLRPGYKYMTQEGVEFTAGKREGYKKTALWDIPREIAFPECPEEMSVSEYWCRVLANEYPSHLLKCVNPVGPIPKQRAMIEKALRSVVTEEQLWQDRCWKIYEFAEKTGTKWGDDEFMEFVETVVPRSWNCDPFGPDHPCPHQVTCHPVTDDWRDPIASKLYVYRSPHHAQEAAQMLARGLRPEAGLAEDVEEGEFSE